MPAANGTSNFEKEILLDITEIITNKKLSKATKKAAMKAILWRWTVRPGKYSNELPWSVGAYQSIIRTGTKNIKEARRRTKVKLIHDHSIPKIILIEFLLALKTDEATKNRIARILKKYARAAIISPQEDAILSALGLKQSLPHNAKLGSSTRWDIRYQTAKIRFAKQSNLKNMV